MKLSLTPSRLFLSLAFGVALSALLPAVQAATYTWDPTLAPSSPAGGTGTWVSGSANWSNGTDQPWTDVSSMVDTAVFAGSAGTVTISGTVGAAGLTLATTGYTIQSGSLNLGANGINASSLSSGVTTISSAIALGANQAWNIGSGASLTASGVVSGSGFGITKNGGGTLTLSGANAYSGATAVNLGTLALSTPNGSLANSAVTVGTGGAGVAPKITFDSTGASGDTNVTRAASLTLNGAQLTVTGAAGGNTNDVISGALTVGQGVYSVGATNDLVGGSLLALTPNSAKNTLLTIGSLSHTAGGILGIRNANNLGANTIASLTANSTNIQINNTAGLLVGGGGASATNTMSIIPYVVMSNGQINGFATYDSSNGVRVLSTSNEYAGNFTSGATTNVRINGGSATAAAGTTINSLWVDNNATITLSGSLTVTSGMYLNSWGTTTTGGTLVLGTGGEAMMVFNQNNTYNIGSVIAGPTAGLTIGMFNVGTNAGSVVLTGSNTYSGGTIFNAAGGSQVLQIGNGGASGQLGAGNVTIYNGLLKFNRSDAITVSNAIGGNGSVTQAGGAASSTVLSGANTYTGATTVSSGTLQIGNGSSGSISSSSAVSVSSGAALGINLVNSGTFSNAISNAGAVVGAESAGNVNTVSGVISGVGSFVQSGQGATTLTNLNTYTGGTVVKSGTLILANGGSTGAISGTLTVNSGGTVSATAADAIGWGGTSVAVTQMNLNGGTFDISSAGNQGYITNVTLTGGTMTSTGGGTFNMNGMTIASNSSATTSLISAGVKLRNGTANTINVASGASNGMDLLISGGISYDYGNASVTKTGAGNLVLTGAASYTGATTISSGTLQIGNGGTTGSLSTGSSIVDNASLVINRSNAVSQGTDFSNTISGAGSLTQAGAGTLTIANTSANNTYSGGTYVNAGELKVTFSGSTAQTVAALGTGAITVNGGLLHLVPSGNANTSYAIASNVVLNGGSIFSEDGNLLLGGSTSASTNTISVNSPTTLYREWGHLSAKSLQLNGILQGSAALTLSGTLGAANEGGAVWINNPSNTYSGTVTVNANTGLGGFAMVVGNNTALQFANVNLSGVSAGTDSPINTGGVQFAAGVTAPVLGSLAGNGNIALVDGSSQAVNLSVGGNNSTTTFSGVLSGSGSLTKNGTGALTLSNYNTYTGGTVVNSGTLNLTAGGGTGAISGTLTINSGALVRATTQDALGWASPSTAVTQLKINGGIFDNATSSNNGYITNVTLTGGTMTSTGGGTFNMNGVTIASNSSATTSLISEGLKFRNGTTNTFNVASGASNGMDLLISGNITYDFGSASLNKTGAGNLVLTGAASYTGATTISSGTLQIGDGTTDGNISASSGIALSNSSSLVYNLVGSQTYGNVISGTGSLTKNGSGSLTLSNFNTFTGGATVNSGTLVLANGGASGVVQGVLSINAGGTVKTTGFDALGFANNTSVSTINVNGGTLDNGIAGNQGYITPLNLTGGKVTSTGGGSFNFNAVGITSNASSTTSTISAPLVNRGGSLTFTVAQGSTSSGIDLDISGAISEFQSTGGITKAGVGTLRISGSNSYTGPTAINAGKLIVSGSLNGSSTATVAAGATLASGNNLTSTVGSVSVVSDNSGFGGTLAVGDTKGTSASIGKLTVNGSLTLGNASTTGTAHLAMEIGGTTAGTGYDQVAVTGALNLTNVQLDGSLFGYTPVASTDAVNLSNGGRFYLVIGATSRAGQFANQNAADAYSAGNPTITFGGQEFAIIYTANYNGGVNSTLTGGNDIALVAVPEPGTWGMMLSGLGLLTFWQRARRRSA